MEVVCRKVLGIEGDVEVFRIVGLRNGRKKRQEGNVGQKGFCWIEVSYGVVVVVFYGQGWVVGGGGFVLFLVLSYGQCFFQLGCNGGFEFVMVFLRFLVVGMLSFYCLYLYLGDCNFCVYWFCFFGLCQFDLSGLVEGLLCFC